MSLLLGNPQGPEELEQAFAAIQTAFNQSAGFGKWIDVPWNADFLRNSGAGNSWSTTAASGDLNNVISYAMFGDSMFLTFSLLNSNLVVATAINAVYLKIPGGYSSITRRSTIGKARMVNGGVGLGAFVTNGDGHYLTIFKDTVANITNDASFTVEGSILMEVIKT